MIRTKQEQTVEFKCIRGGNGEAEMRKITIGDAELYGKGRMFNHMVPRAIPSESIRTPVTMRFFTSSPAQAPIMTTARL